jgi:cupin 2 domain-containing protein
VQLPNLLANLPATFEQEHFDALFAGRQFRLERIVSTGQSTPQGQWYDQDEDEWVLLLSGEAELEFDANRRIRLLPGDQVLIPAHCQHRVAFTSLAGPTVWLALFCTPAEQPNLPDESFLLSLRALLPSYMKPWKSPATWQHGCAQLHWDPSNF